MCVSVCILSYVFSTKLSLLALSHLRPTPLVVFCRYRDGEWLLRRPPPLTALPPARRPCRLRQHSVIATQQLVGELVPSDVGICRVVGTTYVAVTAVRISRVILKIYNIVYTRRLVCSLPRDIIAS